MRNPMGLLLGTGLSVAAAYYFDPAQGRRRRALLRDKLVHYAHEGADAFDVAGRDLRQRATGGVHALRDAWRDDQPDDEVLEARVRSCLGRVVSHPAAIEVEADKGRVTLSGPVLRHEVPLLLDAVYGVRGVGEVRNELEEHDEAGNISALQNGSGRRSGPRAELLQENWTPSARLLGAVAGGVAGLYGLGHRGASGLLAGAGGLWLLARSLGNESSSRLLGRDATRHTVQIQKSLCIHAPVDQVFRHWDNFENFPEFMTHVRQVRRVDGGQDGQRWRWTVTGPTGFSIDFDSVLTRREDNRLLAWRTEGSGPVRHEGRVRFADNGDGTTAVEVRMSYTPIAGAAGHALARLFAADPKRQMDEDLLRMKSFLETGKRPQDAAADAREGRQQPGQDQQGNWLQH